LSAADWPSYNRDLAGTRFSPLAQIDTDNVANLVQAWSFPVGRDEASAGLYGGSELTPLVVGGLMYLATSDRVVAVHSETGEEIWRFVLDAGAPSRRGLAYWPGEGGTPPRIFFTSGRRLIALEAGNGRKAPGFGVEGEVAMPVVYYSAPTVFENLLIVGSNSAPGSVRAYDARTGTQVWEFQSVPKPGEPGHDTWENDAWRGQPNVLSWSFSSTIDVDRGILYTVFESPGSDDNYGGDRPGANLFGDTLVALDVRTGRRLWHFQTVHHDLWDYDLPAPPVLLDATVDGEPVPLLVQVSKTGFLYVLDRITGQPIFGVEERGVPQSAVPGEHSSPTQPIPVKPPPLARTTYSPQDLVTAEDTTPQHAEICRELVERSGGLDNAGPFTPFAYRAPGEAAHSTIVFPGSLGGANWGGAAADPRRATVFVNTTNLGSIGWIEPTPAPEDELGEVSSLSGSLPYQRASAVGGPLARFWANDAPAGSSGNAFHAGTRAWPCQKPPWGELYAVNAATGDVAWHVPLGITDELPESRQHTGRVNIGGPIATAGGLVFIAATNDRRLRAFDARSGEELWAAELPMSAHAVPITYMGRNGKQYVAVTAAGAEGIDDPAAPDAASLVVFALP
jgi:glucose dehydrogenase